MKNIIDIERRLGDKKKELAENLALKSEALHEREKSIERVRVLDRRHEILVAEIHTLERELESENSTAS